MAVPKRIQRVETEYETSRPRDAAIRRARGKVRPPTRTRATYRGQRATIDETFNDTYAQNGMQPSVGYRPAFRSVEVDYDSEQQPSTQPIYNPPPRDERPQPVNTSSLNRGIIEKTQSVRTELRTRRPLSKRLNVPKTLMLAKDARKTATVTSNNLWIIGVGIQVWLFIQLPLALISLAFLGAAVVADSIRMQMADSLLGRMTLKVLDLSFDTVNAVSKTVFGFDFTILDPLNFALIAFMLVFLIGVAKLFVMTIIYQMTFVNAFFGKAAGLKHATFIIAFCGYTFPLLNIVPWFVFWSLVVWRYPK
ncbi:MAG TPA: hypothetical protein VGE31_01265 [Candidatus Paceibacterota bacterium]